MFNFSNLFIPAILFFALGVVAQFIRSDLKFPPDLAKAISIYLLIGIGLHGGVELSHAEFGTALQAVFAALVLGFSLPVFAYLVLVYLGSIDRLNAAAISAHYGSVSAGTFLTAIAFLQSQGESYESYPVIMLAIMESPAIMVGLILAKMSRHSMGSVDRTASDARGQGLSHLARDALTNGSVVLLFGSMAIGFVATPKSLAAIDPFFTGIFMGALSLFLLEMGMEAARRIGEFRKVGAFLIGFGLAMPLIGAGIGLVVGGQLLHFGVGGTTLVAVLGASASYIAVPPAMRLAIPEANPSFYLTLSLGVTFPFNVLVGIPLYYKAAAWLAN